MWEYIDELLAVLIVIGCFILIGMGIDGEMKTILGVASTWVFSREIHKRFRALNKPSKGGK